MTQFDKPRVMRPRIGRVVLAVALAAAVVAAAVWAAGSFRLPMRKAKGDSIARTAGVLLASMKSGNIEEVLQVCAESEAGEKALAADNEEHAKPSPAARTEKAVTLKQAGMSPVEFLTGIRDSMVGHGVVWREIRPLAFVGMQASVIDVRNMKDPSVAVVGDVYFAANDNVYAIEISARCCGDVSVITGFWRCSDTGLKADAPLNALKDRTEERIRQFMEEPIKPGERVGIKNPKKVFVPLQEESKK